MQKIINALLIVVGLINFYPIVGACSAREVENVYRIGEQAGDIVILLRHRAVLLGIIGALMMYAAFRPDLQPIAFTIGLISMVAFLVITRLEGNPGTGIHKIFVIDLSAIIGLCAALGLRLLQART